MFGPHYLVFSTVPETDLAFQAPMALLLAHSNRHVPDYSGKYLDHKRVQKQHCVHIEQQQGIRLCGHSQIHFLGHLVDLVQTRTGQ